MRYVLNMHSENIQCCFFLWRIVNENIFENIELQKIKTSFERKKCILYMKKKNIIIISRRTLITCYAEISRLSISVEQFS